MGPTRVRSPTINFLSGAMHYVGILLSICILLLVNALAVQVALVAYDEYAPRELAEPRAQQGLRFLLPLVMLGLEYWLWDWTRDQFTSGEEEPVEGN